MYRGFGNMLSSMLIVWMIPIVLIVIIIIGVIMIANNKQNHTKNRPNPALDILNERFAKGEIDEEEYLKKKKVIGDDK